MARATEFAALAAAALMASACATTPGATPAAAPAKSTVSAEAAAIHQSLMVLDTHLDTPASLVGANPFDIMARHDVDRDGSQVDVPRMNEGGLDGGYWVIFTPQGALTPEAYQRTRDTALLRAVAIHKMAAANPETFGMATTAAEVEAVHAAGKKVVLISIENSYPLGEDLSLLTTFYKLGARLVGPVHGANNQFADSSTDRAGPKWNGLSPAGKELVKEANRLGMVVDPSHASDQVLDQILDLSATPILLSHSGTKELYDHPRNVPDALLKKLAEKDGVIQMNALGAYMAQLAPNPERTAAITALRTKWGNPNELSPERYEAYLDEMAAINKTNPQPMATFDTYMEQFLHVLKLIGPDHVGMGADWDGGGGVAGMKDITEIPKVTERLLAEGYTKEDLAKIWGGNILRVMRAAEAYAAAQPK
jgi:membrane dipeptidase